MLPFYLLKYNRWWVTVHSSSACQSKKYMSFDIWTISLQTVPRSLDINGTLTGDLGFYRFSCFTVWHLDSKRMADEIGPEHLWLFLLEVSSCDENWVNEGFSLIPEKTTLTEVPSEASLPPLISNMDARVQFPQTPRLSGSNVLMALRTTPV